MTLEGRIRKLEDEIRREAPGPVVVFCWHVCDPEERAWKKAAAIAAHVAEYGEEPEEDSTTFVEVKIYRTREDVELG